MSDSKERLQRARSQFPPPEGVMESLRRRRDRKHRNQRIRAGVLGLAIAIAVGWLGVNAIRSTPPVPADDPTPTEGLGIFAPVAGRIVYDNQDGDRGDLWAVDPSGPSDTTDGPSVADDAASTLVRLPLEPLPPDWSNTPLGWSSDGTELLIKRTDGYCCFPEEHLYILHADGSETQLNSEPMTFEEHSAAISPDGTRVVFARGAGLYVVDAEGGRPVRLRPQLSEVNAPTFSPDGSQIAYLLDEDDNEWHVWVVDADGGNAHEILADEETVVGGVTGLQWSPAGDRLAIGLNASKGSDAIYTFAPDGSDFTEVITGGISPYWSPDGSKIAYTIQCEERSDNMCPEGSILRSQFDAQPTRFGGGSAGLAIADADGSNVREFGFAASGPWHPGE
jgi:dipeptidyl aminopeptidase/acylaminoacyl peptidase